MSTCQSWDLYCIGGSGKAPVATESPDTIRLTADAPVAGGVTSETPSDASDYEATCLRPLPSNTSIIAVVQVDDVTRDYYYSQRALPGAALGNRKWVCRETADENGNYSYNTGRNVKQIDPSQYDAQASSACQDTSNAGYITKLACGENPDLPDPAKYLLWGIAGIIVLILLVWVTTLTKAV